MSVVALRRLGSNRVHRADTHARHLTAGAVYGAPVTFVASPVETLCGSTLRGQVIVIPPGADYDTWAERGRVCRLCVLVLELHEERSRGV